MPIGGSVPGTANRAGAGCGGLRATGLAVVIVDGVRPCPLPAALGGADRVAS